MKQWTCVVIGGGYAGINAVKAIKKAYKDQGGSRPLRLVLIDKNPYHFRKVLLFKPAVTNDEIRVPLAKLFPAGVEMVTGGVTSIESQEKRLFYEDAQGGRHSLKYDAAVVAAGSIVRKPEASAGGIALASLEAAKQIKETWKANLLEAVQQSDPQERQRLLTIAIGGAGISGIETAAELAYYVRKDAEGMGLDPNAVRIQLYNAGERLFPEGPAKVGVKLERALAAKGIAVVHRTKIVHEKNGSLALSNGNTARTGLCVWTLGLLPNPKLKEMGLPLTPDDHILVDACYRVRHADALYSIGDCARIIDPVSGLADGKTCKEATGQAARLAKVMMADLTGQPAPEHKRFMDFFCIGLGPGQGMAWTRQWGVDMIMTGRLGARLRTFTWNSASLQ
ncbi:NAD(P)/FAD-dependent oxidoreductase [Paenibacillus sp. GCM10027627]|uniref:NAD(P)/FAD-dependent oxidoreductase n=1 Tax=unclassified Paenibacillus TaxID=185978 RepID=UPI00363481A2